MKREISERLIRHGFRTSAGESRFSGKSVEQINEELKKISKAKDLENYADHEIAEEVQFQFIPTNFPNPKRRYKLEWETFNLSVEEAYFWVLDYARRRLAFPEIVKTEDAFSAAENSAFFGVSQQRIGLQQDKVTQFLATVGKMIKDLFQLVREMRILDERRGYYEDSYNEDRKKAVAAEITLKGIFIDMVEQGAKNPASVFGMARELQFATLPDLFFSINPRTSADVDKEVDPLEFNEMVKRVLKRKLYGFLKWKESTASEIKQRRSFTLKYLTQHWEVIRMYMNWCRPYLRHIHRLTMDEEKTKTPDLITAFEGSIVEIEFLASQLPFASETRFAELAEVGSKNKKWHSVMLAHFLFRTRPAMSYQQEGYQRGPIHVGKMTLELRSYVWTEEQIEAYKKMKDDEDMELIKAISGSVKAAMESLGDELQKYLQEAKGEFENEETTTSKKPVQVDPFTSVIKGVGELFTAFMPRKGVKVPKKEYARDEIEKKIAEQRVNWCIWETYKNFKREHKMMSW